MKTPEEIKNGLNHCRNDAPCMECEYYDLRDRKYACETALLTDALAYIQQIEKGIERCYKQAKQLEASYIPGIDAVKVTRCRNEDGLSENRYCFITNRHCTARFAAICKSFAPEENGRRCGDSDIEILPVAQADVFDIESIVRCGECVHYRPEPMGDVMMCYGFANGHWTEPNDFCSRGRRRTK